MKDLRAVTEQCNRTSHEALGMKLLVKLIFYVKLYGTKWQRLERYFGKNSTCTTKSILRKIDGTSLVFC